MESREGIPSPESFVAKHEKPPVWQKVTKWAEALAFAGLMEVAAGEATAAEQKTEQLSEEQKIELMRENTKRTAEHEKALFEQAAKTGKEGMMVRLGERVPIRELKTADGYTVTIVYSKENKPTSVIWQNPESSYRQIDLDADGDLDRVILNKNPDTPGLSNPAGERSANNDLKTFDPIDTIAKQAGQEADLMPEKTQVCDLGRQGPEYVLRLISFTDGSLVELIGEEALTKQTNWQAGFERRLQEVRGQIERRGNS